MEEAAQRYLSVFVPFVAMLVCAHYILRSTGSLIIAGTDLASPGLLRRALGATAVAVALIITVDGLTNGDLFLHPRYPESQLLLTLLLIGVLLCSTVGRSLGPIARRFQARLSGICSRT